MTLVQRRIITVLLLAILVALALWALQLDRASQRAHAWAEQQASRLVPCGPDDKAITALDIQQGGKLVRLVRAQDAAQSSGPPTWRLEAPLAARADGMLVDALLRAVCELSRVGSITARSNEPPLDARMFGFVPPAAQLVVSHQGGQQETLQIGGHNNFDGTVYVREPGSDTIDRIGVDFMVHVNRDVDTWRNKELLDDLPPRDIARLVVHTPKSKQPLYTLEATEAGGHTLTAPGLGAGPVPADTQRVRDLLGTVTALRADAFMSESVTPADLKRFGLDHPSAQVALTSRDGTTVALTLGQLQMGSGIYTFLLRDHTGPIVRLSGDHTLTELLEGAESLIDMHVMAVDVSAVREVHVRQGPKKLVLMQRAQDGGPMAWYAVTPESPQGTPIDSLRLHRALAQLVQTRAAEILARRPTAAQLREAELSDPQNTLTLMAENQRPLATLWLGRRNAGKVRVTLDSKQTLFSVFDGVFAPFSVSPEAYLEPGEAETPR